MAEQIIGLLTQVDVELGNGLNGCASERSRPMSTHFDDYAAHLETLQRDARHGEGTFRYLRKLASALE